MAIKPNFKHRFWKNDGTVNAGGKVWTYVVGTTTPTPTYTDSGAGTPNANPIILDSKGEAEIWVVGQIKVNVLESDNTQVTGWPVDNVGAGVSDNDATSRWSGTAAGTANALTISPSPAISAYAIGQSFIFKSGAAANTAATTISVSGLSNIAVQLNGVALSGGEIIPNMWYQGVLSATNVMQISIIGAAPRSGSVAQTVVNQLAQVATGTTQLPNDNTIPQNTEGDQYMACDVIPTNASSQLEVTVSIMVSHSVATTLLTAALFTDTVANAVTAIGTHVSEASGVGIISFHYRMTAGTTSQISFKLRVGGNQAGTTTINGQAGVRLYGGVNVSHMIVKEVLP